MHEMNTMHEIYFVHFVILVGTLWRHMTNGWHIYNSYHVLGRVWQPRDWLVYARAGLYLTCASLYCTFRPISLTAAIAQWALQGAPALWHRSCVRIPWWYYNFLPAGLRVQRMQPCRCQISRLSGRKCGNTDCQNFEFWP